MSAPDFQGSENAPAPPPKKPHGQHWIRHLIRQIIGWALIVIGIIDLPLPGPGWLIIGLGAVVLAPYVKLFYNFVEWIKKKFPKFREPLDRFEARHFGTYTAQHPQPPPPEPPKSA
jgi:uncharacterized protein (TIGR02611 family)